MIAESGTRVTPDLDLAFLCWEAHAETAHGGISDRACRECVRLEQATDAAAAAFETAYEGAA